MLSRTACQLYWMARYLERAENTARMLDVAQSMSLLPHGVSAQSEWAAPLNVTGYLPQYLSRYPQVNGAEVMHFMALDPHNEGSIYQSIRHARDAARAVLNDITVEMWENLNTTWLELRDMTPDRLQDDRGGPFLDWVKNRSHVFRGIAYGTMLRDEAFQFLRMGTFLERADNTARILDAKYHVLLPRSTDVGGAVDYYQWSSLLRSVSAFTNYRKVYREQIQPKKVAELLMLRADMPRSLRACVEELRVLVEQLEGNRGRGVARLVGYLQTDLEHDDVEQIFATGLHEYLTRFLEKMSALAAEIDLRYFTLSSD